MASTTNYGWVLPVVGGDADAWGGELNADLDGIDSTVFTVSGVANTAQSTANTANTTANAALPKAGGTLTGALIGTTAAFSGTITPSSTAGIVGTTTNDNAAPGSVGELIASNVTTNVGLTNGVVANIASITLTAGDWDVSGEVWFNIGTGAATSMQAAISSTSATFPVASGVAGSRSSLFATFAASSLNVMPLRPARVSIPASTTYYLMAALGFPSGSPNANGNIIARRAR